MPRTITKEEIPQIAADLFPKWQKLDVSSGAGAMFEFAEWKRTSEPDWFRVCLENELRAGMPDELEAYGLDFWTDEDLFLSFVDAFADLIETALNS